MNVIELLILIILILIIVWSNFTEKKKQENESKSRGLKYQKEFEESYLKNKRESKLSKEFWDDMDKRYNMVGKE